MEELNLTEQVNQEEPKLKVMDASEMYLPGQATEKKPEQEKVSERQEQLRKCNAFFMEVADLLKDTHVILGSAYKIWGSACLVPKGTEDEVSYYGKPLNSLRVACNWNWRASLRRCHDEKFIQCVTPDLPWCRKREAPEMASKPIWGNMVGYFDRDQKYHCVYGERFNRDTKTWEWVEGDPKLLAERMLEEQKKLDDEKAAMQEESGEEPEIEKIAEPEETMDEFLNEEPLDDIDKLIREVQLDEC